MSTSFQAVFPHAVTPAIPPLRGFRLAKISDIPRIGVVAAASFYHSPVFQYQRPGHEGFPFDTVASYRVELTSQILDPSSVVFVRVSKYNIDEPTHVYAALAKIYPELGDAVVPDESGNIIVAASSFIFKPGSPRHGQFQPEGDTHPGGPDSQNKGRDQSVEGNILYAEATGTSKRRWLGNCTKVGMTATHPAYWSHGHAGVLIQWFIDLADVDQESAGVNAVGMGAKFFPTFGFKCMGEVEVKGYELHPQSIKTWVGVREPRREQKL